MTSFASWNDWLRFRHRLNVIRRVIAIPGALLALPINFFIMNSSWLDPIQPIVGIDPMLALGASVVASAGLGYALGSSLPTLYLRHFRASLYGEYNARMGRFYSQIVKHRANVPADPSKLTQSVDFYGERIASLSHYRSWLRKHREIRRTRTFNL